MGHHTSNAQGFDQATLLDALKRSSLIKLVDAKLLLFGSRPGLSVPQVLASLAVGAGVTQVWNS